MNMLSKKAARAVLHSMGGLSVVRNRHRREFRVLMFHSFTERDEANVDSFCGHIARYFEPVSLSDIRAAMDAQKPLPDNAVAVTVDDGYKSFLLHGHPIFRRHRIPVTLYAVAGFSDGRLWLWPDQIEFGLRNTTRKSIRASCGEGEPLELSLQTPGEKTVAIDRLSERLKLVSNARRLAFLAEFGGLCGLEIPAQPPVGREAMNWEELRAVASEGVAVGCHTETHPILSRLANHQELESEIRGAKEVMEERLGFEVRHFCYPNGRAVDVGDAAIRCVRESGFESAVCCTFGMNTVEADRFQIHRIPFDCDLDFHYGVEALAGLHL